MSPTCPGCGVQFEKTHASGRKVYCTRHCCSVRHGKIHHQPEFTEQLRRERAVKEVAVLVEKFGHGWFNKKRVGMRGQLLFRLHQLGYLDREKVAQANVRYRVREVVPC